MSKSLEQRVIDAERNAELSDDVTAATKRLMHHRTATLRRRAERAEAATDRVRALHREEYGLCTHCSHEDGVTAPCPTIQALGDSGQPTGDRIDQAAALARVREYLELRLEHVAVDPADLYNVLIGSADAAPPRR
ncbi:hypothetical protein K5X85_29120 [Streptomyces sp. A144]|uniref:hypothetical protein n=1 Tax=Streptomyces sp. A144 TaxID=2871487 RepID=UPI001CC0F906|nr:hypothetical protein [Streptomyces sp. A144]UAX56791.1 hypothetical protein K5X85_29120 [Streptomyces sp. A144]